MALRVRVFWLVALWLTAEMASAVLPAVPAQAQWFGRRAPVDFEECADLAEKAATREEKSASLAECNAKFAARRKPGGGYSYFDLMQNRNFDIAGPNPTPEEQKQIDEQYSAYLENQKRSSIAAAFAARQRQLQLQQVSLKSEPEKTPPTTATPIKPRHVRTGSLNTAELSFSVRTSEPRSARRTRSTAECPPNAFSCEWPRLSEGINDLKKAIFGTPAGRDKRS